MLIYVSGDTQVGQWAALRSMDVGGLFCLVGLLTEPAKRPAAADAGKREVRVSGKWR
jgi:hypothetical protein